MTTHAGFEPNSVLATLAEHDVDYVVIGGLAAYLHAAPIATHDLPTLRAVLEEADKGG